MSRATSKHVLRGILSAILLTFAATTIANENVRYRYKNNNGVPVITNTLPAQYAQKGYEILDLSNNVIKIVPPAPSDEDVERVKREREALAAYEVLKRRYSSIDEIDRKKARALENINTNILILKGNISSLQNSVADLISNAAEFERGGRAVPKSVLDRLDVTKAELKISQDLLAYREQEYKETAQKYDDDIRTFILGESIYKRLNPRQNP